MHIVKTAPYKTYPIEWTPKTIRENAIIIAIIV